MAPTALAGIDLLASDALTLTFEPLEATVAPLLGDRAAFPEVAPTTSCTSIDQGVFASALCRATGPLGLGIIATYSFLIAFVLPTPSEIVLLAPLNLGLPTWLTLSLIVIASGIGKAVGSLFAFHIGQEAKNYGPIVRRIEQSRFEIIEWSEKQTVQIARKWGYVGMAMALAVPFFPDTISIYAFTVLEDSYLKFAVASFLGSVGRLLITLGLVGGGLALV